MKELERIDLRRHSNILILVAFLMLCCPTILSASTIKITVKYETISGVKAINEVGVSKASPNSDVDIRVNEPSGSDGSAKKGKTDSKGEYTATGLAGDTAGANSIDVLVGAETWKGITLTGTYKSKEQIDKDNGAKEQSFDGLPFEKSIYSFFEYDGTFYNQFEIVNSSTAYSYNFTSLKLYEGLDMTYFNPDEFYSNSAIATGSLVMDISDATISMAGSDADPSLTFSVASVEMNRFNLMVGSARAILGPGIYGEEMAFAFAASPVPEPSSILLVGSGLLGLAALRKRFKK